MTDESWLAEHFEAERTRLSAVAYRMLGSRAEAEDAVQEAWLRLGRTEPDGIGNLGAWLTTVVARICLDALRARKTRNEQAVDDDAPEPVLDSDDRRHPEREALLADSVGVALLVVLERLSPAERVAFVLHDTFDLSFDQIAEILGRTTAAVRQLASRARRRVQGAETDVGDTHHRNRPVVEAFLAASKTGDLTALLALLAPEIVVRGDARVMAMGGAKYWGLDDGATGPAELHGAQRVAGMFSGRAQGASLATIDGAPGLVWFVGGQPRVVFAFTVANGLVASIELVADPARIAEMTIESGP